MSGKRVLWDEASRGYLSIESFEFLQAQRAALAAQPETQNFSYHGHGSMPASWKAQEKYDFSQ
ncbi:MAG TPA: hypothetical protein VJ249_09740 [Candidatus Bathyarchaeia archaeon]|nr:hypothetical protein [Candidatus Bathyarchaeia archaeon]